MESLLDSYEIKNLLKGPYIMEKYDFPLILNILSKFTLENAIVCLSSKNLKNLD